MIAHEQHEVMMPLARNQHVDDLSRARTAIDVVAQKHLNGAGRGPRQQVLIDPRQKLCQQICAAVNVADGVNSPARGQAWRAD